MFLFPVERKGNYYIRQKKSEKSGTRRIRLGSSQIGRSQPRITEQFWIRTDGNVGWYVMVCMEHVDNEPIVCELGYFLFFFFFFVKRRLDWSPISNW